MHWKIKILFSSLVFSFSRCLERFLLVGTLLVANLEIPERVTMIALRDDTHVVTQLLLLQIFLRQVLEITFGEWRLRCDRENGFVTRNLDTFAKIS